MVTPSPNLPSTLVLTAPFLLARRTTTTGRMRKITARLLLKAVCLDAALDGIALVGEGAGNACITEPHQRRLKQLLDDVGRCGFP